MKDLEALISQEETSSNNDSTSTQQVKVYKNQPTLNPDGLIDPDRVLEIVDGQRFRVSSGSGNDQCGGGRGGNVEIEIEAIHTPGHAKDHMSFLVTQSSDPREVGAIFTADNVLGHGTAVFEDLSVYLDSLALMKRRVAESIAAAGAGAGAGAQGSDGVKTRRAYPGHGAVVEDAVAKIDEYIAHRRMREEEALNVLRFGTTTRPDVKAEGAAAHDSITRYGDSDNEGEELEGKGKREPGAGSAEAGKGVTGGKEWASIEMVKVIYRHYPESLYQPAEYGLLMVLEKLRRDGKVVKTPEGKWRASEKATL